VAGFALVLLETIGARPVSWSIRPESLGKFAPKLVSEKGSRLRRHASDKTAVMPFSCE
jgi:hypothetical protein